MTASAAGDRLQAIRRDKKTLLQDHANAIEALAQVAHGDDNPKERRGTVYKAFFHTVNNPGLQRYITRTSFAYVVNFYFSWATRA